MIGWLFSPMTYLVTLLLRFLNPLLRKLRFNELMIPAAKILSAINFGVIIKEPDKETSGRARVLWESAKKRGIMMYDFRLFYLPREMFFARYKNKIITFDSMPRPSDPEPSSLGWMDNKAVMRKKFATAGIPIAEGGVAFSEYHALKLFDSISKPVITKPNFGSRGNHSSVHINTKEELLSGFRKAKQLSPWAIVEQELHGMLFRATIVGGKVVGVLRRDPAGVFADGKKTVRELVDAENSNPLRHGPIFHQLPTDSKALAELERAGFSLASIPPQGIFAPLGRTTSRSAGGAIANVTKNTHPKNIELFEKIDKVLDGAITGIDFIVSDISKPWNEQKACGVIECNSVPFIDLHHYPLYGEPTDVAGVVWDLVFPESKFGVSVTQSPSNFKN